MRKKRRNGRVTTEASVENEIVHLRGLDLKGLRARWQSVLQRPAPDHLPRHLLFAMNGIKKLPIHDRWLTKAAIRYRYYASLPHPKGESKTVSVGSVSRIPATDIEDIIVKSVNEHLV